MLELGKSQAIRTLFLGKDIAELDMAKVGKNRAIVAQFLGMEQYTREGSNSIPRTLGCG